MPTNKPVILVVDDDPAVCASLKFALALEGLTVHTADNGAALLAHPALGQAKCIVLDYKMPGMDGFQVLEQLVKKNVEVPVILITSPVTAAVRLWVSQAPNVVHLLEKPLLDSALRDRVLEVVG